MLTSHLNAQRNRLYIFFQMQPAMIDIRKHPGSHSNSVNYTYCKGTEDNVWGKRDGMAGRRAGRRERVVGRGDWREREREKEKERDAYFFYFYYH